MEPGAVLVLMAYPKDEFASSEEITFLPHERRGADVAEAGFKADYWVLCARQVHHLASAFEWHECNFVRQQR